MTEVVKVDEKLIKEIEKLIKKNRFIYSNKKQVVNLAILEFLKSISWKEKQNQSIKSKKALKNKKKRRK